jgi:tetratricopeptide (TPR) repeat protein
MQSQISKLSAVLLIAGLLCGAKVAAQNNGATSGGRGVGGTQEVFRFGVGARAQGLGSAVVAMPLDASTIYWNPGGLDFLERRSVVMFYSPLLPGVDAKYHFVGAAYPILNFGTVGLGWLHYDVGDITLREDGSGADLGTSTSGEDEFFLSYAKQISFGVALGGNFKIKRQQHIGATARAFGVDFGLLYRPDFGEGILENVSFGVSVLNMVRPSLKLVGYSEARPRIFRGGVAKSLLFGSRPDQANLFLAFEKAESQSEKMRYNFGTEYVYQNLAMLRAGYNGGGMTFGGGVMYQNMFEIDYAYGKFDKDDGGFVGAIHRVSMTMHLGKTKTQMREDAEARVLRKIEEETRNKEAINRRNEFDEKMNLGKNYFQQGEYFSAFINFSQAREISAGAYTTFSPQDKEDTNIWVERAKTKMDEETRAKEAKLAQTEREKTIAAADRAFIEGQTQKGMQYLQAGKYNEAINEWKRGLERDPSNTQLKDLIAKTEGQISSRRGELVRKAQGFVSAGQIVEAINVYTQLMNQPDVTPAELKSYQDRVAQLQKQMNSQELFRKGYTEYLNKNYCVAKGFFAQGLQTDPNNTALKKHYYDADVRCNARPGPIPDNIRQRYLEAIGLLNNEDYDAALRILEEIQPLDRYNQRILSAIDQAREGRDRMKKAQR